MFRSILIAPSTAARGHQQRKGTAHVFCLASDDADRSLRTALKRWDRSPADAPGFTGENGDVRVIDSNAILLGLGKRDGIKPSTIRVAAARLLKVLDRMQATAVVLFVEDNALPKSADRSHFGRAIGEGLALANWRFDGFAGSATTRKPASRTLTVAADDRDLREGIAAGLALAMSVNYARSLGATPPNVCTPAWIAGESKRLARSHRLKVRVITYAEAKRFDMGGLVHVGRGSESKPCLVVLEWRPLKVTKAARDIHLCLVGKTITYDTGGYSLKVNNGMKGMKYDKCGGTAVLGAMHAIASARLPVRVTALLPAAENMVSGDSYRPDDIITMHNGVTVEVTNTDAEGRLVLADALSWACRTLRPSHIVDVATLTGGVVTALGSWCAGLMCNDADLRSRVERAGDHSGDRVWHLPLWNEHREHMRSQHADLINSNPSRLGHPLQGGAFLSFFVDEKVPWAHIDIAGVASVDSPNDLCTMAGPTGFGVRLLHDLAAEFAS